jgi:hypothetical protein
MSCGIGAPDREHGGLPAALVIDVHVDYRLHSAHARTLKRGVLNALEDGVQPRTLA